MGALSLWAFVFDCVFQLFKKNFGSLLVTFVSMPPAPDLIYSVFQSVNTLIYLLCYLFYYLAARSYLWPVGSSDQGSNPGSPCVRSTPQPLDHQGSPNIFIFNQIPETLSLLYACYPLLLSYVSPLHSPENSYSFFKFKL